MVRLATVGTSAITEKFLAACRLTGRYVFKTAYSRDKSRGERFAAAQGFSGCCDDLVALACDSGIDAVYIATPNVFHAEQSRLFLENGKHVLCEKPIVTECGQYDRLSEYARKNGLVYAEAIMSRHCAGRDILLDAVGKIGKISLARIDFGQLSSRYARFAAGESVNIFDMSLGAGTLMDLGVYCVYAAADLFGMPRGIKAGASFLKGGADGAGAAVFDYGDFTAVLSYSKTGQSAAGSEITGDRGTVKIGSVSQYAGISLVINGEEKQLLGYPPREEVMRGEAEKFAGWIENPKDFAEDYKEVSILTHNVHKCMDMIKSDAKIKYPLKEYRL